LYYYTKNIADFNNATRHLTRQERSLYSDLIELQYDLETPIPNDLDWICRKVLASTESERTDVQHLLNEFFDLFEQGWSNGRCAAEICEFQANHAKKVLAGKASGKARKRNKRPGKSTQSNKQEQTLNTCSTNVELTNNQEPITNNQINRRSQEEKFSSLWNQFDSSLGDKGSRKNALKEFSKLSPDDSLLTEMLSAVQRQSAYKREVRRTGAFVENFQHVERWLRNERWQDEIPSMGQSAPQYSGPSI